jgi:hypothetical protein
VEGNDALAPTGLSAGRCLDPPTPSASPATLLTQAPVLIDLAGALAIWAIGVCWMQRVGGSVLQRQLRDVAVQDGKPLFIEKDAKRKPQ